MTFKGASSIAIALLLLLTLTASAQTSTRNITVTALVDGRDFFYITPASLHWQHWDFVVVGRYFGNWPTGLFMNNGDPNRQHLSWIPDWPCWPQCYGEDSSTFPFHVPIASQYHVTGVNVIQSPPGGAVRFHQSPNAGNGYTTIIDFDDNPLGGPHWYTVLINVAPNAGAAEPEAPAVNPVQPPVLSAPEGLTTIYSNLALGDAVYNCCLGLTISGPSAAVDEYVEVASGFTPAADFTITEAQVAISSATGANEVAFGIWTDNHGVPGEPLQRWYPKSLPGEGTCCTLTTRDFAAGIPVKAGTPYWFVVRQRKVSDVWTAWNLNASNATGPTASRITHGTWINQGEQLQGAFALYGQ